MELGQKKTLTHFFGLNGQEHQRSHKENEVKLLNYWHILDSTYKKREGRKPTQFDSNLRKSKNPV